MSSKSINNMKCLADIETRVDFNEVEFKYSRENRAQQPAGKYAGNYFYDCDGQKVFAGDWIKDAEDFREIIVITDRGVFYHIYTVGEDGEPVFVSCQSCGLQGFGVFLRKHGYRKK